MTDGDNGSDIAYGFLLGTLLTIFFSWYGLEFVVLIISYIGIGIVAFIKRRHDK
jgi:hypothetical protein